MKLRVSTGSIERQLFCPTEPLKGMGFRGDGCGMWQELDMRLKTEGFLKGLWLENVNLLPHSCKMPAAKHFPSRLEI